MFKTLRADKDAYITNRVINNVRSYGSNTGLAGTLDVFKLYGLTLSGTVPNTELSRLLVHFDLTSLKQDVAAGRIDPTDGSFWARLNLSDVYGGQPTPDNYTLSVTPLSMSFDEGHGKDVVYYQDYDRCNFLTSSQGTLWGALGCSLSGTLLSGPCDYFIDFEKTQRFVTGEEDMSIDVTDIIRNVLTGTLPDSGFRIAFTSDEESDQYTRFVKRFASRHAYDESKHPRLIVGFDDSLRDDSEGLTLDSSDHVFMFNYDRGAPANLLSGTTPVIGDNSLLLKLLLAVSGGYYDLVFTGSQHRLGNIPVTGTYSSPVHISSLDPIVASSMIASGSVIKLTPVWCSLDNSVTYLSASAIDVYAPTRSPINAAARKLVVTVYGLNDKHDNDETVVCRVNLFDYTTPRIKIVKTPVNSPGALQGVASDAFYSVRDVSTNAVVIPYDTTKGSTRLSSDALGLYFTLDMNNLEANHSYVIDVLVIVGGTQQRHPAASGIFSINPSS